MQQITQQEIEAFNKAVGETPQDHFGITAPELINRYNITSKYDTIDVQELVPYMFHTWKNYNFNEQTLANNVSYIFDFKHVDRDLNEIVQLFDKKDPCVLDTGCCWGSLAIALSKHTNNLHAIDHVREHATVTAMRVPGIHSYMGDARYMEFEPNFFDVIVSRGVIEHVGDYTQPRGRVDGINYAEKLRYLKSCARSLKEGGALWLSTGNFYALWNGEVNDYFSHWLDGPHYQQYLDALNTSHDMYWLLSWEQMESLAHEAGLIIERVVPPDPSTVLNFKEILSKYNTSPVVADILADQAKTDPHLMDSWLITMRKKGGSSRTQAEPSPKKSLRETLRKILRP